MHLTPTAELLLARRYLLPGETPPALFARVAGAVGALNAQAFGPMEGKISKRAVDALLATR